MTDLNSNEEPCCLYGLLIFTIVFTLGKFSLNNLTHDKVIAYNMCAHVSLTIGFLL